MKQRLVVSKDLKGGIRTKAILVDGKPIYAGIISKFGEVDSAEYSVDLAGGVPDEVGISAPVSVAKQEISNNPVLRAAMLSVDGNSVIPLRQQFGFVAGDSFNRYDLNQDLIEQGYSGRTIWEELNTPEVDKQLRKTAVEMFPEINSLTNKKDIDENAFYAPLVPLVSLTGIIPHQSDDSGKDYFNPEGTVTVAEFLDSLNATKSCSNSEDGRKNSLDNVSNESDFFNVGYNQCLSGMSSPFYRLYTRRELMQPITRLELAYITVICWQDFRERYGALIAGRYRVGIHANWDSPAKYLRKFADGLSYKVYKKCRSDDNGTKVLSVNIQDYLSNMTISEFKNAMKDGLRGIPLPLIMCLVELDMLDMFYFEDMRLDPLREVSRAELTYFVVKLAKAFPMKFMSDGDNSYMK